MVSARSISRREQKIFVCGAFICCFIIAVTFSLVFKPYLDHHLPIYNYEVEHMIDPSICNLSNSRSDVYDIIGDVRIHGSLSTIFVRKRISSSWTVKPYARKQDTFAMGMVTTLKIKYAHRSSTLMKCNQILSSTITPAIIFSTGGYAGNHFHAFTDILLPLYVTSRQFNRNVLFLVCDKRPGWISKYRLILHKLSKYDVVDMENYDDDDHQVFCFSRVIIGLKADKEFTSTDDDDPMMMMTNFTKLLRSAYSLQRESVPLTVVSYNRQCRRPRMLIVCRRKARHLVNKHAVANMARDLGFDVVLKKIEWNVSIVARLVNSFDVMVGVHGAGLTNMVFLPENAILIQIIPFGLDSISKTCFQIPAQNMKLRYLEYKASVNESSLSSWPDHDTQVNYTDPAAINKKGFDVFRSIYLDNQDLHIDLGRFRKILFKALELLRV